MSVSTPAHRPPTLPFEWRSRCTATTGSAVIRMTDSVTPSIAPHPSAFGPKVYADHPPFSYPDYRSTVKRARTHDMVSIIQTLSEVTGPRAGTGSDGWSSLTPADSDLTTNAGTGGEAIGSRTIVVGRVT